MGARSTADQLIFNELTQLLSGKPLTDQLALTDALTLLRDIPTSLSESLGFTETFNRLLGAQRILSDIFTFTETLTASVPSGPSSVVVTLQDLWSLDDLLAKLQVPFGLTGGSLLGISGAVAPLVTVQLAVKPSIATFDYLAAYPQTIQQFLFHPTSMLRVTFIAENGNRDKVPVRVWHEITLNNKPYLTTVKEQNQLNPGVPTAFNSWVPITEPGVYAVTAKAEAETQITLQTQTVTVDVWQLYVITSLLWAPVLIVSVLAAIFLVRQIQARRIKTEAEEKQE